MVARQKLHILATLYTKPRVSPNKPVKELHGRTALLVGSSAKRGMHSSAGQEVLQVRAVRTL